MGLQQSLGGVEQKRDDNGPLSSEVQGVHCDETLKNNLCGMGPWCRGAAAGGGGPQGRVRGNGGIVGVKEGRQRYR